MIRSEHMRRGRAAAKKNSTSKHIGLKPAKDSMTSGVGALQTVNVLQAAVRTENNALDLQSEVSDAQKRFIDRAAEDEEFLKLMQYLTQANFTSLNCLTAIK